MFILSIPISFNFSTTLSSLKGFGPIKNPGMGRAFTAKDPRFLLDPMPSIFGSLIIGIFLLSANLYN